MRAVNWRAIGNLYQCRNLHPKMVSHAANPLALHLRENIFRVFFSARDAQNRSSVGAVDIDILAGQVIKQLTKPVFEYGPADSFYSHGVSVGNIYSTGTQRYMLFMGWKVPELGHWFGQIGRLLVGDDLSLTLDSATPFLPLDRQDPISLSYPWVENLGNKYGMWYGSTTVWDAGNGDMLHTIRYAESEDGHTWKKHGDVIPHTLGTAQAFSRPTVVRDITGCLSMWFSFRRGDGSAYRIGESHSINGLSWSPVAETKGFLPSQSDEWDSHMREYPFVFRHEGKLYMLYKAP